MQEYITNSPEETQKIAHDLAKTLKGGEIFVLSGDLGAGKTTFIQGLARGLEIKENLTSPTFVLMKIYNARDGLKLAHLDCYRIDANLREFESESMQIHQNLKEELGLNEILEDKNYIIVIEWGERIMDILPPNFMRIEFGDLGGEKRKIVKLLNC